MPTHSFFKVGERKMVKWLLSEMIPPNSSVEFWMNSRSVSISDPITTKRFHGLEFSGSVVEIPTAHAGEKCLKRFHVASLVKIVYAGGF